MLTLTYLYRQIASTNTKTVNCCFLFAFELSTCSNDVILTADCSEREWQAMSSVFDQAAVDWKNTCNLLNNKSMNEYVHIYKYIPHKYKWIPLHPPGSIFCCNSSVAKYFGASNLSHGEAPPLNAPAANNVCFPLWDVRLDLPRVGECKFESLLKSKREHFTLLGTRF